MRWSTGCLLGAALLAGSCRSPSSPTKPTADVAAIGDLRYEHVIPFAIDPSMRVELEFVDCSLEGLLPGLRGPSVCLLTSDGGSVFRCPNADFMKSVVTTCDHGIDVAFRTASGNPLLVTAHNIYLNGTKVLRLTTSMGASYPVEVGTFRIDRDGKVH
jgi:hypothetical protein